MSTRIRTIFILLSLLLFPVVSLSQVTLEGALSGTLEADTYEVVGSITVNPEDTLVIEAGTRFEFMGFYTFAIQGYLEAEGTEEDSIVFMAGDTTAWSGIVFQGEHEDSCRISYALITGASTGAIYCQNSANPVFHHVDIVHNAGSYGAGISCSSSNPRISYCLLLENNASVKGGGIYCIQSSPHISHSQFIRNDGGSWGGGMNLYTGSAPLIEYCTIEDNVAGSTGGGFHISGSSPTIRNSVIDGNDAPNYGGGINLYNGATALVDHCLIVGNTTNIGGAGIYHTRSSSQIRYCTIVDNVAGSYGGGVCFYESDSTSIVGCIVSTNTGFGGLYNTASDVLVGYNLAFGNDGGEFAGEWADWIGDAVITNANGDDCDLMYNIQVDAGLAEDYTLSDVSPALDAGNWNDEADPDGTLPDIGAFYYEHEDSPEVPEAPGTTTMNCVARLQYSNNHAGIKIVLVPQSPFAERDSTYTNATGNFSFSVITGVYDLVYSYDEYQSITLPLRGIYEGAYIAMQTLAPDPISGSISGIMGPGFYRVDDTLRVETEDSLTIMPGTTILFDGDVVFEVNGVLLAEGTSIDSILFYPSTTTNWQGIHLTGDQAGGSRFSYCRMLHATPHAVEISGSSPQFVDTEFRNNNAGNRNGAGVLVEDESAPLFKRCLFRGNTAASGGGAVAVTNNAEAEFVQCTFVSNTGDYGSSAYIMDSSPTFNSCLFTNDNGQFLFALANCAGLSIHHCLMDTENNLFYGEQELPAGMGVVDRVNASNDSTDIFFNLYCPPLLRNVNLRYYTLTVHSPALNAGDPDLPLDADYTVADIGAFPYTHQGAGSRFPETIHSFGELTIMEPVVWECRVVNTGSENLVMSIWECNTDAFRIELGDSMVVAPGEFSTIPVCFDGDEDGVYNGILTIYTNNPLLPEVVLRLTGSINTNDVAEGTRPPIPETFSITSAYPNPFNARLSVEVGLPQSGRLLLDVYNVLGQRVTQLADTEYRAGYHLFSLDGDGLATGLYFVRAQFGGDRNVAMQKVMLLK